MKIVFEKIVPKADSSFAIHQKRAPAFDGRYHFHPEFEITLIESSSGRRVVGDSIDSFSPGDLVLLGENLPHQYLSNRASGDAPAAAKVIQFRADVVGDTSLRLPEFQPVAALLRQSRRGLTFDRRTVDESRRLIDQVFDASTATKRLLRLLDLLDALSRASLATPIASTGYLSRISTREGDMMNRALGFLHRGFTETVTLDDLCRHLHVSPATCNRLLQKSIGRSFKTALIEIRISHACRLLVESDQSVLDVAYSSGFTNLSNFNRRFREIKGQTPREYRNLLRR